MSSAEAADTPAIREPDEPASMGEYRARWWHVRYSAAIGGVLGGMLAMGPSLLPRPGVIQGVVLGVGVAIGYGIGLLVAWLVRQFTNRPARMVRSRRLWQIFGGVALVIALYSLWAGKRAQDDLFVLMQLEPPNATWYLVVIVVGALVAAAFVGLSRLIRRLARAVTRWLTKVMPARTARAIAIVVVALLVISAATGLLRDGVLGGIATAYEASNDSTTEGVVQPTSGPVSGAPDSLVPWDTLGSQGRDFVVDGTTTAELDAFNGGGAIEPIRAYVGLESAPTVEERAQLAVDELEQLGAFEREILAVGNTTGTGWIDEGAVDPLEYMYNGDVATVAMQYSYLPSWVSFLVDQQKAKETGVALFDAVYEAWLSKPADSRPELVVFGESLGSFGGEAAFSGVHDMRNRAKAVLFSGPPNANEQWRKYTELRDPGSPEVLPIYQDGVDLRWAQTQDDLSIPTGTWGASRVLYLQNASDPIVWWSPNLLFNRPDWLDEPRGEDVLPSLRWWPIITFFQISADMIHSTGVPIGHGHSYGANQVWAWAAVLQPPGWTQAKTDQLYSQLS